MYQPCLSLLNPHAHEIDCLSILSSLTCHPGFGYLAAGHLLLQVESVANSKTSGPETCYSHYEMHHTARLILKTCLFNPATSSAIDSSCLLRGCPWPFPPSAFRHLMTPLLSAFLLDLFVWGHYGFQHPTSQKDVSSHMSSADSKLRGGNRSVQALVWCVYSCSQMWQLISQKSRPVSTEQWVSSSDFCFLGIAVCTSGQAHVGTKEVFL